MGCCVCGGVLFGGALFLWMLRSQSKYPDMLLLWLHSNFDGMKMCTSGHGFTGGWGGIQKNCLALCLSWLLLGDLYTTKKTISTHVRVEIFHSSLLIINTYLNWSILYYTTNTFHPYKCIPIPKHLSLFLCYFSILLWKFKEWLTPLSS